MIVNLFLSAVLLGIVVAIPPGSVTIIACQRALQNGFKNSIIFLLGSSISDVFYIILVYIGVANLISNNIILKTLLWLICGVILIVLGIISLISLKRNDADNKKILRFQSTLPAAFISGILVTLTNPMTIVGWIAIAGNYFLIWTDKFPSFPVYWNITIFFIMIGVMIWFVPLVFIISRLKKIISKKIENILIIISNIFLIIFGLLAFYYALNNLPHF